MVKQARGAVDRGGETASDPLPRDLAYAYDRVRLEPIPATAGLEPRLARNTTNGEKLKAREGCEGRG